jgi:ABC-type multidrug transport system fused ATPase/permease subunit
MSENVTTETQTSDSESQSEGKWTIQRIVMMSVFAFVALILILFVIGLLIALFGDVIYWAAIIQIARDIIVFVIAVQGILIVTALAILILQIARLINLVKAESVPIFESTQETLKEAKATTQFVSKHSIDPIIKMKAFFSGLLVFFAELFKINSLIKPNNSLKNQDEDKQ